LSGEHRQSFEISLPKFGKAVRAEDGGGHDRSFVPLDEAAAGCPLSELHRRNCPAQTAITLPMKYISENILVIICMHRFFSHNGTFREHPQYQRTTYMVSPTPELP
jgi:hypothetical protein